MALDARLISKRSVVASSIQLYFLPCRQKQLILSSIDELPDKDVLAPRSKSWPSQWRWGLSLHQTRQSGTGGATARYYSRQNGARYRNLFDMKASNRRHEETSSFCLWPLKQFVLRMLPGSFPRFLNQRLRTGSLPHLMASTALL